MAGYPLIQTPTAALILVDEASDHHDIVSIRQRGEAIAESLNLPFQYVSSDEGDQFFLNNQVRDKIAAPEKRTLLLAGGLLEGAVTQVAVSALLDGFDVFVIADLCCTAEPEYFDLFRDRIRDCGATFVTAKQVILECQAKFQ